MYNVPGTGLEPAHRLALGSKPSMSTIPSSRHTLKGSIYCFGTLGLEPRQTASEAVVLPLDDIPMKGTNNKLVAEDGVEPPIFGL
jgi:hypothetical protein